MQAARVIGPNGTSAFVPNGDSRADTATVLIGTARENGLDDRTSVYATQGGFYISDALADLLYEDDEDGVDVRTVDDGVSGNPGVAQVDGSGEPVEEDEAYDPAEKNIPEVKAHVESHPEQAGAILSSEKDGENRSTLVKWLTEFIDNNNGSEEE